MAPFEGTRIKRKKIDNVGETDHPDCSTGPTTIHDLTPELLVKIFSWFSVRELCLTISRVCRIWRDLSKRHCLWKHLSFKGQRVTTERVCMLLAHATELQSLMLVDRVDASAVLRQVTLCNPSLKILIVKYCDGSPLQTIIHDEVLVKLIKGCNKLVQITLKDTQFYPEKFFKKLAIVLPDLKRINFNYNKHLESTYVNIIAQKCKPLEEVCVFRSTGYGDNPDYIYGQKDLLDEDIKKLCMRMKSSLRILKIEASELTDTALEYISQCTCLRTLGIRNSLGLTDEGIVLLMALHNLTSLEVSSASDVSFQGWRELFISANFNSLRELSLYNCYDVTDYVLEIISKTCPNLESIILSSVISFANEGLTHIIKGCRQLKFLEVDYTDIKLVQCFPLIPTFTPNLRLLVYEVMVTGPTKIALLEAGRILHDLKKSLPRLRIHSSIIN